MSMEKLGNNKLNPEMIAAIKVVTCKHGHYMYVWIYLVNVH